MPPPPQTDAAGPVLEAAGPDGAAAATTPVLFQFLHGQDAAAKAMTTDEITELGDAFTQHVLLRDDAQIPLTLAELVTAIQSATAPGFPRRKMFMVDEGAIPHGADPAFELNTRLVFTWSASDADPPDILVSTVAIAGDPRSLLPGARRTALSTTSSARTAHGAGRATLFTPWRHRRAAKGHSTATSTAAW
jgi:hypothetical protein